MLLLVCRRVALLVPLAAAILGVWRNWPWLVSEHARLEGWKIPLIWLGELTALFWYLFFLLSRGWHDTKKNPIQSTSRVQGWPWSMVIMAFTIPLGMIGDAMITFWHLNEEITARRGSLPAVADVVASSWHEFKSGAVKYQLVCRFLDQNGHDQQVSLFVRSGSIPVGLEQTVRETQFPVVVNVFYDPNWPGRCWLREDRNPHNDGLPKLTLLVIEFQVFFVIGLAIVGPRMSCTGFITVIKVMPFVVVALVLVLWG